MRKKSGKVREALDRDRDTMRDEYDFSDAVPLRSTARYRQWVDAVVLDPDVKEIFPDSAAVNAALRSYARMMKRRPRAR